MILGTGCLGEQALDGAAIRAALAASGLDGVLLVLRDGARATGLAGLDVVGVRGCWARRDEAARLARATRAPRVVLEPEAELPLERACRELHAFCRAQAGLAVGVATPATGPLAAPDTLALLFEDLAALAPGYWHRPSRARLAGHEDAAWLDAASRRLVGLSLDDVAGGAPGLPPGLGELDFKAVREAVSPSVQVALDVDPLPDASMLRIAREQLSAAGFP